MVYIGVIPEPISGLISVYYCTIILALFVKNLKKSKILAGQIVTQIHPCE